MGAMVIVEWPAIASDGVLLVVTVFFLIEVFECMVLVGRDLVILIFPDTIREVNCEPMNLRMLHFCPPSEITRNLLRLEDL